MSKKILIADDNDDLRMILAHQLHMRGYTVIMASDGRQAIDKCKAEMPDLVILDILMPGMDGTEAGEKMQDDPTISHIPVIFLTALVRATEFSSAETDQSNRLRLTLPKSIAFNDLVEHIEKILARKRL
jgi:CheY-like chemotaxis protein